LGKKTEDGPSVLDVCYIKKTWNNLITAVEADLLGHYSFGQLVNSQDEEDK
jgi:hypothetical protein